MISCNPNGTFSANAELNLYVAGERFELGQLGHGCALLGEAQSIDTTEGEVESVVDDKVTRWKVRMTSLLRHLLKFRHRRSRLPGDGAGTIL